MVSLPLYLLDLLLTFAPSTFLPELGSRLAGGGGGWGAGFVPRCLATASLGFWHQITSTSSLAVHQQVISHLR